MIKALKHIAIMPNPKTITRGTAQNRILLQTREVKINLRRTSRCSSRL